MEEDAPPLRAELLLTLSSAARRLADLVAAAETPLRYEVLRHLLRVSEETMTEVLEEAVRVRLVRRGANAFTYVPGSAAVAEEMREALGPARVQRLRTQIAVAMDHVFAD
jgi:hypothetical protein